MLTEVPQAILESADEINESLLAIDCILQLAVLSRVTALPSSAPQGTRYIVPSGPRQNHIAFMTPQGTWRYFVPRAGWQAYVHDEETTVLFNGTAWVTQSSGGGGAAGSVNQHKFTFVRGGGLAIEAPVVDVPSAYFPVAATIKGAIILAHGGPGSCEIDLWKTSIGTYPPTVANSICNGAPASISSAHAANVNVSEWNLAINAGDTITAHLNSSSAFDLITMILLVE